METFFVLLGNHLRCSTAAEVKSVYLPLGDMTKNYSLTVVVTVKNEYGTTTTTVPTQVCYLLYLTSREMNEACEGLCLLVLMKVRKSSSSVEALQTTLEDTLSQLEQQGLLTSEALGQIFTSVSDMLNTEANQDQMDARMEVIR